MHQHISPLATKEYLAFLEFKDKKLMMWSPNYPDLNPYKNFWAIIK